VRASLNYGHTFAHVIENLTGYKSFLHGEAVAAGMVMANELAKKVGLMGSKEAEKIKKLLENHSLPTHFKVQNPQDFYQHFFLDKKSQNDKIKFVLPKGIGDFTIRDDIEKDDVIAVLKEFGK